jgi:hypothetical protein
MKTPNAPAVKREAEEDWGKERWRMTTVTKNRIMIYGPKPDGTYVIRTSGRFRIGPYSTTSSASASSVFGTLSPIAFAVFRLSTNRKRVGCSTGRSAG